LDGDSGPTTQTFPLREPKRAKTARNRSTEGRFQADSAPIQTDREDGVRLHETAGGQGSTSHHLRMQEAVSAAAAERLDGPPRHTSSAGALARPTADPTLAS
jgi:hypothetical protein